MRPMTPERGREILAHHKYEQACLRHRRLVVAMAIAWLAVFFLIGKTLPDAPERPCNPRGAYVDKCP